MPVLPFLFLLLFSGTLQAAEIPPDKLTEYFVLLRDAERLEAEGRHRDANARYEKALPFERAYEDLLPRAHFYLGVSMLLGDVGVRDAKGGVDLIRFAAGAGRKKEHARAQELLGDIYLQGEFVGKDVDAALSWYGRAADNGSADALFKLGRLYGRGEVVRRDLKRSVDYLERSAGLGSPYAKLALGILNFVGDQVRQDYGRALSYFEDPDLIDNDYSMAFRCGMYRRGQGVGRDCARALELCVKAAGRDNPLAQLELGDMYYLGDGVERDLAVAREWYGRACDNGSQRGCVKYREIQPEPGENALQNGIR